MSVCPQCVRHSRSVRPNDLSGIQNNPPNFLKKLSDFAGWSDCLFFSFSRSFGVAFNRLTRIKADRRQMKVLQFIIFNTKFAISATISIRLLNALLGQCTKQFPAQNHLSFSIISSSSFLYRYCRFIDADWQHRASRIDCWQRTSRCSACAASIWILRRCLSLSLSPIYLHNFLIIRFPFTRMHLQAHLSYWLPSWWFCTCKWFIMRQCCRDPSTLLMVECEAHGGGASSSWRLFAMMKGLLARIVLSDELVQIRFFTILQNDSSDRERAPLS